MLEDDDVKKIAYAYHTWRNNPGVKVDDVDAGVYEDIAGSCKAATLEEVKINNYVLSPRRYVGTEEEEDDGIAFEEKMEKLTQELIEQFEEGEKLEKEIKRNLKSIGFD